MYHVGFLLVYYAFGVHPEDQVDYFKDEVEPLWCICEDVVHV